MEITKLYFRHSLLLNICHHENPGMEHRIVWCPYIPDEEDTDSDSDDDSAKLLLTTHGCKGKFFSFSCFNLMFF